MKRLDDMLTAAINGSFSEKNFDESRLSALESRLWRYLTASALSERNVREQKDQISALISDISHQTKTPVANLQLYAQLLAEQPLTPQGKDCAAAISAQAEKLQTLIEALVKTSRLETGILALHPQPGEISLVVERAATQYAARAAEKGITLTVGQKEGSAVFDLKWTEEAVCNLLDNAVKYTPPGGTVTVEVKNYELFSAIRVTDTGPGHFRGGTGQNFRTVLPRPGRLAGGGSGHRSLSHPADCGKTGRLCESRERTWKGKRVFPFFPSSVTDFFQNCHILERTRTDFPAKVCIVKRRYRLFHWRRTV